MFTKTIKATAIAATLALGALAGTAATSGTAEAHGVGFQGKGFSIHFGSGHGHYHGHRGRGFRNKCRPGRALRKARSRGLRRARLVRLNRRVVVVRGRKWGDRVTVGFANRRGCPVRFVRAW